MNNLPESHLGVRQSPIDCHDQTTSHGDGATGRRGWHFIPDHGSFGWRWMWREEGVPDQSKCQDLPEISSQWLLWDKPRGTPPKQPYLQLGVTVDNDFEFILGPDGKPIHPSLDIRLTEGPSLRDNLWEQRNCSSPSVRMLGTRDRPYWSRPNMQIRFTSALAHYLTRAVCPEALRRVMGGRYPNGPREWTQAYNILQG